MKQLTMNQYRALYRSNKFDHVARVFIYALNDFEAEQIVMDTYDIPRQWITNISLFKKGVDVIYNNKNTYQLEVQQ